MEPEETNLTRNVKQEKKKKKWKVPQLDDEP